MSKPEKIVDVLLETRTIRPFDDMPDLEVVYDGDARSFHVESAVWNQFNDYVMKKLGIENMMMTTPEKRSQAAAEIGQLMQRWKASRN